MNEHERPFAMKKSTVNESVLYQNCRNFKSSKKVKDTDVDE